MTSIIPYGRQMDIKHEMTKNIEFQIYFERSEFHRYDSYRRAALDESNEKNGAKIKEITDKINEVKRFLDALPDPDKMEVKGNKDDREQKRKVQKERSALIGDLEAYKLALSTCYVSTRGYEEAMKKHFMNLCEYEKQLAFLATFHHDALQKTEHNEENNDNKEEGGAQA